MTQEQATELAVYAKQMFPRANDSQLAAVRDMLIPFGNPLFARQMILSLASETNEVRLDLMRNRLNEENHRQGVARASRYEALKREQQVYDERRRQELTAAEASIAQVDSLLADFTDQDLADLKTDALASLPAASREFLEKANPRTHRFLRSVIYHRLTKAKA